MTRRAARTGDASREFRAPAAGRGAPGSRHAAELLAAQDEERRRIARELHDGTAATLVALSLELARLVERVPAGESRELATACASLCEQSLRELRAVAFILHPPLLEREGLALALQRLTEGFARRSGIQVLFSPGPARPRLPYMLELTLFRTVQEALTNVLRHSGSRTARVALAFKAGEVRLTVSDRGKARADRGRGEAREGVGLASMRERVEVLGGSLALRFRRTGAVLTVVVPTG